MVIKIHNTLVNSNLLVKYLKNNRREIHHYYSERKEIVINWKKKLSNPDKLKNLSREEPNYPYFQRNFLEKLLGYEFEKDWVFEDPYYTEEGKEEFIILNNNNQAILFIEIKGSNQDLDKPQPTYNGKTPVQQAYNYALNAIDKENLKIQR